MMPGFRQVPYNDLEAVRAALSPATAAILIEGIQGEGGVTPASPQYLLGLRQLCDEKRLLLLMDAVQDGHFRTGRFQSFQRILESAGQATNLAGNNSETDRMAVRQSFLPDGVSMAKSLGGGFPMGAFWVRAPYADLLGPGTHGTTYGGSPLACAVALKILEVIQREKLADNARQIGAYLKAGLEQLIHKYPGVFRQVRGLGLMLGLELAANIATLPGDSSRTQTARLANLLHAAGLLVIPAGPQIVRLLPPLNLRQSEAEEGLRILESVAGRLSN
jgi:acetylornithine aminotransferase/acetylornithine/N-succinyldiaminopimelate aminotransferase